MFKMSAAFIQDWSAAPFDNSIVDRILWFSIIISFVNIIDRDGKDVWLINHFNTFSVSQIRTAEKLIINNTPVLWRVIIDLMVAYDLIIANLKWEQKYSFSPVGLVC